MALAGKLFAYGIASLGMAAVVGIKWLAQPIELPLGAFLFMVLLPVETMVGVVQEIAKKRKWVPKQ